MALAEPYNEFLRDFGVSVAFVGADPNMLGIVDAPGLFILADQGRGSVNATDRTVVVRSDQLGTLAQEATIVVDAVPYLVREIQPLDDGAFTLISLR
jgi:hypothetical protein